MEEEKDLEFQDKKEESKEGESVEVLEEAEKREIEELRKKCEEYKKKCEEYKDNWIRTSADFDNYRKRVQKEREEYIEYGNESILKDMVVIVDNLERALDYIKNQPSNNVEGLLNGVELIYKQMLSLLEKYGVRPIKAVGEKFDPFYHEVVEQEEVEEGEDGVVLREYQKGYMYKVRVLRPSLVVVSKRKEQEEEKDKGEGESDRIGDENEIKGKED